MTSEVAPLWYLPLPRLAMALVDDAQFRSARASLEAVFSSMVTRYMAAEESDVEAFVAQDASALAEGLKGLKTAVPPRPELSNARRW